MTKCPSPMSPLALLLHTFHAVSWSCTNGWIVAFEGIMLYVRKTMNIYPCRSRPWTNVGNIVCSGLGFGLQGQRNLSILGSWILHPHLFSMTGNKLSTVACTRLMTNPPQSPCEVWSLCHTDHLSLTTLHQLSQQTTVNLHISNQYVSSSVLMRQ